MAFSQMLEILKEKEKGTIVFVKLGSFYIAVGEDAVLIHKKLNLKCTCFKMNICKVGFPAIALNKYVEKLNKTKYSYVIYDYDAENIELKEITRKRGKYNLQSERNLNCLICSGDDDVADKMFKFFQCGSKALIEGKLEQNMNVNIDLITKNKII